MREAGSRLQEKGRTGAFLRERDPAASAVPPGTIHGTGEHAMRTENGFTLLELLVVLFLIMLLLGIAAVSLTNSLPSSKVNATARDIASTLKHARSLALIQGEEQVLSLDMDAKRYGIEGKAFRAIPEDIAVRIADPLSGEIQSGTYRIVFRPMGGAEAGVIVVSNSKRTVRIEMDPVVGAVRLK